MESGQPTTLQQDPRRNKLGRDFNKLFGATAFSAIGTGMHVAALPLLVVQFTHDPVALGLVVAAAELPWVLLALHAGVLVDRLDRRRVMVWADLGRCALLVGLCVLIVTSQANLSWLLFMAFGLGAGQVFFDVASRAVVPDLVPHDQHFLSRANGRISAAESNGEDFLGPPVGSLLFGLWNVIPFAGNALSFAVSGTLIGSMRRAGPADHENPDKSPRASMGKEIAEGVRWLLRSRPLRTLAIVTGLGNIVFSAQFAMLVVLAKDALGIADAGYGLLLTAAAIGGIAGGLIATRAMRLFGPGGVLFGAKISEGLAIVLLGLTTNALVAGAMMMVTGCLMTAQKVVTATLRQQIIPRRTFGRVLSVGRLIGMAGGPVGAALGGVLAAHFTVHTPYVAGGVFLLVVAVLAYPALNNRALSRAVTDSGGTRSDA